MIRSSHSLLQSYVNNIVRGRGLDDSSCLDSKPLGVPINEHSVRDTSRETPGSDELDPSYARRLIFTK